MELNYLSYPQIAQSIVATLKRIEDRWSWTVLSFVIMPNHLHGILVFHNYLDPQADNSGPTVRAHGRAPLHCSDRSLGSMMKGFKSGCRKRINLMRQTPGKPVWQRNYHEHIIRNDEDLRNVREYILDNPLRWEVEHP